ncbi:MAG: hypothetical protein D6706_00300 [Chloroflexi bacterium]|nr:MAG: hypothetical protein D6706_00300 [Chloroflexota bacterium]
MEAQTFSYTPQTGWSVSEFPVLDSKQTLVIVFGAPEYIENPAPIQELAQAYPQSQIVGCSTAGEIFGTSINDHSLSVAVIKFERTRLATAVTPIETAETSYQAGSTIAHKLIGSDLRAVFILSDGIHVNGSELVRGINAILPGNVIVTGGLAGDGDRFERTWVLKDGKPQSGFISAVGLYGENIHVGHGSKGGWDIFGPERRVTRSRGNILYELDGQPALQLYKEYLGERAAELPASALLFPLALRSNSNDEKQIVRTILAINEADQSMTFAGDIPEGSLAQLMKANFDRLIDGASEAALMTHPPANTPVVSVAISCVGRRLVMGEYTEEELEATLEALPVGVHQIGFYSYGEISPYASGHCDLHNQTMTLTTFAEI